MMPIFEEPVPMAAARHERRHRGRPTTIGARVAALVVAALVLTPGAPATADEDGVDSEFWCPDLGRFLTDLEFLEAAFAYEVEHRDLDARFQELGIERIREIDPGCCSVEREDNPYNETRTWLERLLTDPQVLVVIGWDLDPNRLATSATNYDMTVCGDVIRRHGSFRELGSREGAGGVSGLELHPRP